MTNQPSISHGVIVPEAGFRWIFKEKDGAWVVREPPDDWPEAEYEEEAYVEPAHRGRLLADRFYLAASRLECLKAHRDQRTMFGQQISEPELYLRIASERPTPQRIADWANTYGLLNYGASDLRPDDGTALSIHFDFGRAKHMRMLRAEPARAWLLTHNLLRSRLATWEALGSQYAPQPKAQFLEEVYNRQMGGSLTHQVRVEPETGALRSEIMASSLASALHLQWGMSIVANVEHRQCSECPTWFAVHPGSGRPEKLYCSDACRMRAYRKRKGRFPKPVCPISPSDFSRLRASANRLQTSGATP